MSYQYPISLRNMEIIQEFMDNRVASDINGVLFEVLDHYRHTKLDKVKKHKIDYDM